MGVNASRVKYIMDTDSAVLLRNISDGAETSTATETAVSLNELDTAYWDNNEIPYGIVAVEVFITACDRTTGDETYVLTLQVDDTSGMSDTPVTVATLTLLNTYTGVYHLYFDSKNIPGVDTDSSGTDKWLAIKATLGGTTPSITYGAWIAKSIKT